MRLLAAVLLGLLGWGLLADPWCCPDGCSSEGQHASDTEETSGSREGECVLCLGGLEQADHQWPSAPIVSFDIADPRPPLLPETILPPPEQPPRS